MSDTPLSPADGGPFELSISRYIAAPPHAVWHAMIERIEEWWCPVPWRVSITEQDRRPGGALRMTMHGPEGETIPQDGIYLAFEPGVRFITTDAITPALQPAGPFMIGVWEIAPEGEGTRYTASARHWRAEDRDAHEAMGFTPGWSAAAEQLAKLCEA